MVSYVELFVAIFVSNLIPAFAPPTWLLLSRFQISDSLDPLITLLVGVAAAACGRVVMYIYSNYFYKYLPNDKKEQVVYLSKVASKKSNDLALLMFIYSLGPLPSNVVFIFSGLASLPLMPVLLGFFFGRLISYSLGMFVFREFIFGLEEIGFSALKYMDLIGIIITILLLLVDWKHVLKFANGVGDGINRKLNNVMKGKGGQE